MIARRHWINLAILLLAFALRIAWLEIKPAHFDEGVNGYFVDQITRQGFYHYDPTNFHGPFHFYVLFVAQTLLGRHVWVLRLPIVLVSTACVGLVLAFRRYFDERACQVAALAMAVSPAMVFYGRYAIHETWLLFFLLLIAWGLPGLWRWGERRFLWATALGVTGLIVTKETYVIHLVAFLLAVPCLLLYEKLSPSATWDIGGWKFQQRDRLAVGAVCLGLIVFFYSGGFLDWSSLPGMWQTFATWVHTGTAKESGHEKEWYYWLRLMGHYEWPALFGLAGSLWLLAPRTPRAARYLAIYGLGALIGYSIVAYKTPWCLISLMWPFYFVLGLITVWAADNIDRWTINIIAALLLLGSFGASWNLNFHNYTDENEPYVYVQTLPDVNKLLEPLRQLTQRDPIYYQIRGHLIMGEQYPFTWLLADYPHIDYSTSTDQLPDPLDADFLLVDADKADTIEPLLHDDYYKLPLRIRGNSDSSAVLYLSPRMFTGLTPADSPKFEPGATNGQ